MPDASARRAELYSLLGDLPDRHRPISAELISTREQDGYVLETLVLDLNGVEPVPAYFVRPPRLAGPAPAVLYNHAHGGRWDIGKEELLHGREQILPPPYARQLTDLGYSALCIDAWNFGERRGRTESELFKELLWKGQVLWGLMIYDSLRAVDYLTSRPEVDGARLATIGLSMGSTMAWWLAALDERIKVCIDLCCMTDYHALIQARGLDNHGIYYYVPSLLKHFDTAGINALTAPRAHLSYNGNLDSSPTWGLDKIDAELKRIYAEQGVPERWRMLRTETGHYETAFVRAAIVEWLHRWL
jgi:hypothetical protein